MPNRSIEAIRRFTEIATYYANRIGLSPRRRSLLFFESDLSAEVAQPASPDGGKVVMVSPDELQALEYCGGWMTREEAIRKLQGTSCWMAATIRGRRMLGYMWGELRIANLDFFDLNIPVPDTTAYMARFFVHPEARSRGLAEAMLRFIAREASLRGYRRIFVCCVPENHSVRRVFEKVGARQYLTAHYLRLGDWRRYHLRAQEGARSLTTGNPEVAARGLLLFGSRIDT